MKKLEEKIIDSIGYTAISKSIDKLEIDIEKSIIFLREFNVDLNNELSTKKYPRSHSGVKELNKKLRTKISKAFNEASAIALYGSKKNFYKYCKIRANSGKTK